MHMPVPIVEFDVDASPSDVRGVADELSVASRLEVVLGYHERTKHRPGRYARALGYMDWATQPDPFRRFRGAKLLSLVSTDTRGGPGYDDVMRGAALDPAPLDVRAVSHLLRDSLALSAWKQAGDSRWALRVNPSSGNLHPTEGYLLAPAIDGLNEAPALYHYAPREHALEQRCTLSAAQWAAVSGGLPDGTMLFAFTSIHWREAWKYGERAYRYCQHDAGHAMSAVSIAAAALGWRCAMLTAPDDDRLATMLGIDAQRGDAEAEHPDCLLLIQPSPAALDAAPCRSVVPAWPDGVTHDGEPNRLSVSHHDWSIIDAVAEAASRRSPASSLVGGERLSRAPRAARTGQTLRSIVHQRRSAVEMDGTTNIPADRFFSMLRRVASDGPALHPIPWSPRIDLCLFVHRIDDLSPGVYMLLRDARRSARWQRAADPGFAWTRAEHVPDDLPLLLLQAGDCRSLAGLLSCHQHGIAASSAFAVAMLADFEATLDTFGPWAYRMLHWEAGAVGQALYLEAEAHGVRATGIGCFFDDSVHELLGLRDRAFQVLYNFTVGGAVEDERLQTHPPYAHRE
jgi:SagB-type dehydrogenase family enzyme